MSGLRHVIRAALATPWAIQPEKLQAIAEVLARHANGVRLSAEEIQVRIGGGKGDPVQGAGVAVLPLYGIIGHRMGQVQNISGPGGTSTEQFGQWFDAALGDPGIGAIVLDIDSPGGGVGGVLELADKIFRARGEKPIIAIANSLAASAAYWIATAADELWVTPSGDVGSIGVYALHQDLSAALADEGITNTLISAGKYKVEGNPYEPLSDEARSAMQERVDEFYTTFTKAVATYRGVTLKDVQSGFGEGRIVTARKAVQLGMADKVGALDTLLSRLGAGGPRSRLKADAMAPLLRAELPSPLFTTATLSAGGQVAAAVVFTDAAVVAAAPVVHPTHAADEAKEHAMPPSTAAADAADELMAGVIAAEAQRIDDLLALASEYGRSHADVLRWKSGKTSLADAQSEVLADLKKGHQGKPALSVSVRPLDGGDNGTKAGPFRTLGENLQHIKAAGEGRVSPQLSNLMSLHAAATGASATVGADGAFLIQTDHSIGLLESSFKAGEILSKCDTTELGPQSDSLEVVYLDEVSRATGSRWGGVQVFRVPEAPESVTNGKPQLGRWERRVEDIEGVAVMTERLLADAPAMADVFSKGFNEEFKFVVENECWRGTGVGQGLGVTTMSGTVAAAGNPTVIVAKQAGQAADTILYENIQKMWRSVQPRARARGAWYINVEVEEQLDGMMVGTGTSGQLVYMPPGGLSGQSYGTIKGRPVIPVEYAAGLGDVGDILFADWDAYKIVTKGGVESDESIHVRFIQRERTFRWVTRVNGAPKDKAPVTPFKATDTNLKLSSFVTLAAR